MFGIGKAKLWKAAKIVGFDNLAEFGEGTEEHMTSGQIVELQAIVLKAFTHLLMPLLVST